VKCLIAAEFIEVLMSDRISPAVEFFQDLAPALVSTVPRIDVGPEVVAAEPLELR
jgi:hypothetical protein